MHDTAINIEANIEAFAGAARQLAAKREETMTLTVSPARPMQRRVTAALLALFAFTASGSAVQREDRRAARDAAAGRCCRCHKKNWDCRC